ncbi:MAG: uroporphyrinogen decarboxylase family protein [Anaerolineae bacterium]
MSEWTPRRRVQAAIDHQEPDRVPLDLGTGGNSSPVPEAYRRLTAHLGIDAPAQLLPHMLRLSAVDERILEQLAIDTRPVGMRPPKRGVRTSEEPGCFYDDFGVKWREVDTGETIYREMAENPLADASIDDLDRYPWWPDPLDPERFVGVQEQAERLYHETDYALVGCPAFNGVWERATYLCGMARMLEGTALEPEFVHAVLRRLTDQSKAAVGRFLELVGPYIQIIKMTDDLGSQNAPLMSPRTYREVIKPYHSELYTFIKERTAARIFMHSCGSVYALLPDLIDAGVEILNPVQVSAGEMDTRRLKAEFGDRLSFMGAIDTQHALPFGTVEDVRREVERRIADLAPGGGYIVAPVHNVQADVPPENLVAMYQHARVVGHYPISPSLGH